MSLQNNKYNESNTTQTPLLFTGPTCIPLYPASSQQKWHMLKPRQCCSIYPSIN